MLNDSKARRFIDAFTDYWLDLRKIDDSSPSTTLYNDYELDDPLKLAAVEETRLFVQELFHSNLPARTIVDSTSHSSMNAWRNTMELRASAESQCVRWSSRRTPCAGDS